MSVQISPWSTQQKSFNLAIKNRLRRLSPIRRPPPNRQVYSHRTFQPVSDLTVQNYVETLQRVIQKVNQTPQVSEQSPYSIQLRRQKERVHQYMQQNFLLSIIKNQLSNSQSLPFSLPHIRPPKHKIKQLSITTPKHQKVKNLSLEIKQPKSISPSVAENSLTHEDDTFKGVVINYNPFDDRKIMQNGLKMFRSERLRPKKNIVLQSVKIKQY